MNDLMLPMALIQMVDILGSSLMILLAVLCFCKALTLKRKEPQNVIWTYLLWFCAGLFIFSVSRSVGHLVKHLLIAVGQESIWRHLRPITGSLNSIAFVIVGSITLFFRKVYDIYTRMQSDKAVIEKAHASIMELNANLEEKISERTKDLSASEEKYRIIFEGSKDMIFICDQTGGIMEMNPSGLELLGVKVQQDVIGRNLFDEFILEPKGLMVKKMIEQDEYIKDIEVVLRGVNGNRLITLFSAAAKRGEAGAPAGFEGTVKDISMRKEMDQKLLQTDKLASLGQLSAGVAHEINNPLGLILGYTQLIMKGSEKASQLYKDLKVIEKHAMNCKKIVEDLLKFSRATETSKRPIHINELLGEVLEVIETKFGLENVKIEKAPGKNLPQITLDPDKIRQVFMNLLMNARQAIEGKGRIMVATSLSEDGRHIIVTVSDTGCGIPADIIDKIFDPFFTTKSTSMGTGLGLSVSYGIIKDHDGDIQVKSTVDAGSTFTISLPIAQRNAQGETAYGFRKNNQKALGPQPIV